MSMPIRFRTVAIENTHRPHSRTDVVSVRNAPVFLRHFGHLVESVEWRLVGNQKRADKLFRRLAKYCGRTLKRLNIRRYSPNFNRRNQFPALEQLKLYNAEPSNFRLKSPLKHLEIHSYGIDLPLDPPQPWFVRHFPHLESVCLNSDETTNESVTGFLTLNPQLRVLEANSGYLTPMVFESIAHYARDIERVKVTSFEFDAFVRSDDLHNQLVHLSALRKLAHFGMSGRLSLNKLFKMFAENDVPIQSLEVDMSATDGSSPFPTVKTLNSLRCICRSNMDEDCLVNLVKSQTALQKLEIVNKFAKITPQTIEKILKCGKNLTHFELSFCDNDFDLATYNRILALARDRVKVQIIVSNRKEINVPTDILAANGKWLRMKFD